MPSVEDVFKSLGDPVRLRIVEMLAEDGEMCVCRIIDRLGMTQPAVSHHLASLKNAGLVKPRKQGQWVFYSLVQSTLHEVAIAFLQETLSSIDRRERAQAAVAPKCCCEGE